MGIDDILRIERIQGQGAAAAAKPAGAADFRRLLEELARLSKEPQAAVENADELARALQQAERDYGVAMELRSLLEQAFRRKMS
jgi:hypothetical protein